ncbi:MAG: peptidoglycan DD-metalloendopeptidase family protein [Ilumatobacteraceae bacterium]
MHHFRRLLLVVMLVFAAAAAPAGERANATVPDGETAEDAAAAISAARQRANDAADAWADAQSKLDLLQDDRNRLDDEVAALVKQIDRLQEAVDTLAVKRYLGTTQTGIGLLTGNLGPTEQGQAAVLVGIVNETSESVMDQYDALSLQLADKQQSVEDTDAALTAAQDEFAKRQQQAKDEVARLKVVEQDRLNDEAVQRALDAQRQKAVEKYQRAAAAQLAKDQAAAIINEGGGSDGGDEGAGAISGNSASSGSSGGTTGGGGSGNRPFNTSSVIYGQGESWVCPVQGPTAFADTYGEPRSGGRLHQGVDMISARGTPIVAVVDGEAIARENTLGGTTISFVGNDGNRYYYAHLDSYAQLGQVVKGTVIGYVGDTGNAMFSTPHLHFEIHPDGGAAVNPYPTVAANC